MFEVILTVAGAVGIAAAAVALALSAYWRIRAWFQETDSPRWEICSCRHDWGTPTGALAAPTGLVYQCSTCGQELIRRTDSWPPSCTRAGSKRCSWPFCQPTRGWRDVRLRARQVAEREKWALSDQPF